MKRAPVHAWLRAVLLVPVVFALAIVAAGLVAGTGIGGRFSADRAPSSDQAPVDQGVHPMEAPALTLPLTLPPAAGSGPVNLVVRITTVPPVPVETLEASRGYLTDLLRPLVTSPPPGWTPDSRGLAILQRAIEETVPVSLAPSLPEGTQVMVEVTFAAPPATPVSP